MPVFFWLLFGTGHRALAAWLLGGSGATDWVDGYVARRWHQVSNVGKILDPTADRILVIAGLLAVAAAGGVPWWFAAATLTPRTCGVALDRRAGGARSRADQRPVVGKGLHVRPDDNISPVSC